MNSNNNKLLWIVVGMTVVMVAVGFGSKAFVDKVSNRVIQKLQKEYSPSPYGPGIDPDKLDTSKIPQPGPQPQPLRTTQPAAGWNTEWENQRR